MRGSVRLALGASSIQPMGESTRVDIGGGELVGTATGERDTCRGVW